jgi:hypothetical protein
MLLRTCALALAAAGAAGCAAQAEELAPAGTLETKGVGSPFGDNAQAPHPQTIPQSDFEPTHYAVVYLEFGNGGHLIARHAYFPGAATPELVKCAVNFLRIYHPTNHAEPEAAEICQLYKYKKGSMAGSTKPVSQGFDNFMFGSQGQIYIFVENDNVGFNNVTPISFTGFGAFDRQLTAGLEEKDPNRSFYNAVVEPNFGGIRVLIIDNYYLGLRGHAIGPAPDYFYSTKYSMNINLVTCRNPSPSCTLADSRQVIPITVDPDTGNGWGNEP